MNRRGFLQACLATATAPYVSTAAGVLMPVRKIITLDRLRHPLSDYLTDLDDWYLVNENGSVIFVAGRRLAPGETIAAAIDRTQWQGRTGSYGQN